MPQFLLAWSRARLPSWFAVAAAAENQRKHCNLFHCGRWSGSPTPPAAANDARRFKSHTGKTTSCALQVMYGAGPTIQLLLGSGAHYYLEFKLVQGR